MEWLVPVAALAVLIAIVVVLVLVDVHDKSDDFWD